MKNDVLDQIASDFEYAGCDVSRDRDGGLVLERVRRTVWWILRPHRHADREARRRSLRVLS
jgi:hypothetical protein